MTTRGSSDARRADLLGILDTVDLPIVGIDSHFTIASFNRAASATLGLTTAHIGQSPRLLPVLADMTDLEELCARAIATGTPSRHEVRRADGWFLLRVAPYTRRDQETTGVVLTLTNVTAFRASIEQAVYDREFTKTILNTVSEPLVVLDAELRVQTANRAFYEQFDVSREESQGVALRDLRNHTWSSAGLWGSLKQVHSGGHTFQPLEMEHVFPRTGRRTLLLDARRLSREGDPAHLILLSLQDISDRKEAEEQLRRSEFARVARVTSLGALTASIAHEVNQPLSGIVTNASTCLRMLAADPPNVDGARETVRRTIRDANRASEVITRLRALFCKQDITAEAVDLNDAAREVIALSLSELQSRQVILRAELASDIPLVVGDPVQLLQVILNLLLNAADAMSGVDDRPRDLVITTARDEDDRVRLTMRDSGVGFEPQNADRLFEAFYTTKRGGMGIGLSVSRSIIESHHGRLWATPNDGPGATFAFSIPSAPESGMGGRGPGAMRTPALSVADDVMGNP